MPFSRLFNRISALGQKIIATSMPEASQAAQQPVSKIIAEKPKQNKNANKPKTKTKKKSKGSNNKSKDTVVEARACEALSKLKISDQSDLVWLKGLQKSEATLRNLLLRNSKDFKSFPIQGNGGAPLVKIHDLNNKFVAIDCEMVLTTKSRNFPARVSLVDYYGDIILDTFVAPEGKVKDFRTRYSGITRGIISRAHKSGNIIKFQEARDKVRDYISKEGVILIGHDVGNDTRSMKLKLEEEQVLDTQKLKRFATEAKGNGLKRLLEYYFGIPIQVGKKGHNSVEDARASMLIFRGFQKEFHEKNNLIYAEHTEKPTEKPTEVNEPKISEPTH